MRMRRGMGLGRRSFAGSPTPLSVDPGPARLPAGLVQWGVELSAAVLSSTLTLSGKVALPRIGVVAVSARTPLQVKVE